MADNGLPPVPETAQILTPGGLLTPVWSGWFRQLFKRVGGFNGSLAISDGSITTPLLANNAITNAKAAKMPPHTFKGNNTGVTANPLDLTQAQLTAELNAFVGDSGSGGTKGLVPAPGSGSAAAGKYLGAGGTFSVPAGFEVNIKSFGVVGDGVTDDTAAVQAWANALGPKVVGVAAGTFKVNAQITFPINVTLDLRGAVFDFTGATGSFSTGACFFFSGGALTALPALSSDVSNNSRTLSFVSAPSVSPDDVIVVFNSTTFSYSGFRSNYYAGEMLVVGSVSGSTVTTFNNPYASYAISGGTIAAYKLAGTTVRINGGTILCVSGGTSGDPASLQISLGINCVITGLNAYKTNYANIYIDRCHNTFIHDCVVPKTLADTNGTSYGISVGNSQRVIITGCNIESTRHGIVFGGAASTGAIPCRDLVVDSCVLATSSTGGVTALNVHGNCEHYSFTNNRLIGGCTVSGNFSKVDGNFMIGDAAPCIEMAELLGFDHVITNNVYQGWVPATSASAGYFLDCSGVSSNFTSDTAFGGTLVVANNTVRFNPSGSETSAGVFLMAVRNRGCTQKLSVIVKGNTIERPYDSVNARDALYCDVVSGSMYDYIEISDNSVRGYGFDVRDALQISVKNNTIMDASTYGVSCNITLATTLRELSIVGNHIRGSKFAGVAMGGSGTNTFPVIEFRNNVIVENNLVSTGSSTTDSGAYLYFGTDIVSQNNYCGGTQAGAERPATYNQTTNLHEFGNVYYGTGAMTIANTTNRFGDSLLASYNVGTLYSYIGNAGIPAYSFIAAPDMGMYTASGRLAFATLGTKRLTIEDFSSGSGTLVFVGDGVSGGFTSGVFPNVSDGVMIFGGSTGSADGGQIRCYGGNHLTKAEYLELAHGNHVAMTCDASSNIGFGKVPTVAFDSNNPMSGPNGTAGAPTFTFTSTQNMGVYRADALTLGLATEGLVRLKVSAFASSHGAFVFLGDATSAQTNGIFSNAADGLQIFGGSTGATAGGQIVVYGSTHATKANFVEIRVGATAKITMDGSGNVTLVNALPIASGGSGQTTAQAAMDAFAGAVTSGSYLRGNGTHVLMAAIQAADVPTLNQNTSGSSASCTGNAATVTTNANMTGPITGTGNVTSITSQTGTGTKFVVDTAPTIAGLLTQTGQYTNSFAGTASNPAMFFSGSPFTGGSGTTTRPAFLFEDAATPSTGWSTSGTYIGVNALSTFSGDLLNLSKAGTTEFNVTAAGSAVLRGTLQCAQITLGASGILSTGNNVTVIVGSTRTFATVDQVQIATSTNNGSTGTHAAASILPTYNQTSTAGGTDLLINRTESAIGSGAHKLIDAQIGSSSKFAVDRTGAIGNAAPQTTLTGSAGTALCNQPFNGSTYKKVMIFLSGFTDTGTQTYTFPTAFTNTPFVSGLAAGVSGATVTASTIKFTVTTQTGFVFLEGY